jgi:hypothetical protein
VLALTGIIVVAPYTQEEAAESSDLPSDGPSAESPNEWKRIDMIYYSPGLSQRLGEEDEDSDDEGWPEYIPGPDEEDKTNDANQPEPDPISISHLRLKGSAISRRALGKLLGNTTSLTKFTLLRYEYDVPSYVGHLNEYHNHVLLMGELNDVLVQVQDTLEHVQVTHGSKYRCADNGALDFGAFSRLKSLTLDPAFAVGRRRCYCDHTLRLIEDHHPLDELAWRLPSSLEQLNLVVDLEQVARNDEYRLAMLVPLLDDLTPNLREVNLFEPQSTAAEREPCGHNLIGPIKVWNTWKAGPKPDVPLPELPWVNTRLPYPGISTEDLTSITKLQAQFRVKGIELRCMGDRKPPQICV